LFRFSIPVPFQIRLTANRASAQFQAIKCFLIFRASRVPIYPAVFNRKWDNFQPVSPTAGQLLPCLAPFHGLAGLMLKMCRRHGGAKQKSHGQHDEIKIAKSLFSQPFKTLL
jgi:hypothetical protein